MIQEQSTEQRTEAAVIEAVADAMYPYWLVNGNDVKAALTSVHQSHPVAAIRQQAWASHRFVIDYAIGERAHEMAMIERRDAARGNAG